MKCTKVMLGGLIAGVAMVNAMPTLEQARKVEPLVMDLMREDQNALKSGKKTRAEAARSAMEHAKKVESEAAKLLLMKGAFNLYVRAGEFDKAVETLRSLKAAIPDIPPQSVTNMIEAALRGVAKKEDGELFHKLLDESNASVVMEERNPIVPETATEKTRKAIAKLFPGWSLDTEVCDDNAAGIQPIIRGKRNVTCVHPKKGPSVISRTVKLSGNNPCLSLCVASWNDDADILLSVRVNGKEVLTNRVVGTTDAAPWEDIVVPLSAWRGSTAKIEVGFANYGRRWYEIPCLARVDIIEADGDMSVKEGKCELGSYTWSYRAQNGEATIVAENDGRFSTVISPCPVGNLTIPATIAGAKVTHIGRDAFRDCSALTSVTVPDGVLRIGRGAFFNCSGLRSIAIPSSVKIIERDAFANCTALTSVSIPEGVTIIDRGVFYLCDGLGAIEIPSSVTQIGRDAFAHCRAVASVTIPGRVADIGPGAFRGWNALESVTIPASVTNIDHTAFCGTGALTSFQVERGNRFYKAENGMLLTKDGTTLVRGVNGDVTIPTSVTAIGPCAFEGCVSLRSLVIPSEVKSIGPFAFKQCRGMKSVTIPSGAQRIEQDAFHDCGSLTSVTMCGERPDAPNGIFKGCGKLKTIRVPANAKSWEGMKDWQGIQLVFDGDVAGKEVGASGIQTEKFPLAQGIDLEMIKCPAGEFMMGYESWKTWGSSQNREQRKLHRVRLTKDFMLGKFPVTCSQWYAIMENGKKAPKGLEDTPVGNITVPEMQAFCDKLTAKFKALLGGKVFRLPTDAEWEYASKGGKNLDGMLGKTLGRAGQTGSSSRDGKEVEAIFLQMGYVGEEHARVSDIKKPYFMWKTLPVGKHKPNEWGFMDFIGNAWEATADKMMDSPEHNEQWKNLRQWNGRQGYSDFEIDPLLKGERHLIRTGFWDKGAAIGHKNSIGDNDRFPAVGFRVCIGEPLGDWNNAKATSKLIKDAFALNAAPGSITELNLGDVPPLQFVYCPAGKFSMGYKEQPALSKVKEIEITSPFWVSKTPIRVDQLASLGINSITDARIGAAGIDDASIVVQKLPSVLKERFGKMLPPGYVFRLPTEAEFEYLQKAETKDKNAPTNIWGVERLYSGGIIALLDRAPAYGRGVDVVNDASNGTVWTNLVKVNYENQPDKDPVGWSDDPNWCVFRRRLARNCNGGKLITNQRTNKLSGFYFVVAPDVDKLNKFYWK